MSHFSSESRLKSVLDHLGAVQGPSWCVLGSKNVKTETCLCKGTGSAPTGFTTPVFRLFCLVVCLSLSVSVCLCVCIPGCCSGVCLCLLCLALCLSVVLSVCLCVCVSVCVCLGGLAVPWGRPARVLGASWGRLGRSWGRLGVVLGASGGVSERLRTVLGHVGVYFRGGRHGF